MTAPAPALSNEFSSKAEDMFLTSIDDSKGCGDEWLSEDEVIQAAQIFRKHADVARSYIRFTEMKHYNASIVRKFVRHVLHLHTSP